MSPARPGPRALTLIELLLALGLFITLSGLVFVSYRSLEGSARLDDATARIDRLYASARAWAMREGEPVAISLGVDGRTLRAERLEPADAAAAMPAPVDAPAEDPAPSFGGGSFDDGLGSSFDTGEAASPDQAGPAEDPAPADDGGAWTTTGIAREDSRLIVAPWARLVLDERVRLWPRRPLSTLIGTDIGGTAGAPALGSGDPFAGEPFEDDAGWDAAASGAGAGAMDFEAGASDRPGLRLAIFLPDGTLLLAAPAWVCGPDGGDGVMHRLDVHPWTGATAWTEIEPPVPGAPIDGDDEGGEGAGSWGNGAGDFTVGEARGRAWDGARAARRGVLQ